jgi:hypothetical protein
MPYVYAMRGHELLRERVVERRKERDGYKWARGEIGERD